MANDGTKVALRVKMTRVVETRWVDDRASDDTRPLWLLTTCASKIVSGKTKRGRPGRPVRTGARNTVRTALT